MPYYESNNTVTHMHHIVPRHMEAFANNCVENLIEMTVEEHAEAHRVLFDKYGMWQDELAWKGLSGLISHTETARLAQLLSVQGNRFRRGIPHTEKTRALISKNRKGKRPNALIRIKLSEAQRKRAVPGMLGKKHTAEWKAISSTIHKGKPEPKSTCPHCGLIGGVSPMSRWHFDNCKKKLL
jgi:hypothetical protein